MFPGLDPLTLGTLAILAGNAPSCPDTKPAEINVVPRALPVRYDYSNTVAQMRRFKTDTINPHGFGTISYTQGLMQGSLKMQPVVNIEYVTYPDHGVACAWYKDIQVDMELDPQIIIAREVYNDQCMKKAVTKHELKHVRADREIMNKYAKIMGGKIYAALKDRGYKSSLVPITHLQPTIERMQNTVQQVLNHEYAKLNLERQERQSAIDTKEEYESVRLTCPNFDASGAPYKMHVFEPKKRYYNYNQ